MFTQRDVVATMKSLAIRVKESTEQVQRLVDCHFVLRPLLHPLAADIAPGVAQQLFTSRAAKGRKTWVARPEVNDVGFNLTIPRQCMALKTHADVEASHEIDAVDVRKVRGKRGADDPDWTLHFVATFELPDKTVLSWLCHQVNEPVAVTFAKMQKLLPMDDAEAAS
jgi:hypothetical protein